MDESTLQQTIQIEGVQYGTQLMRNNSGAFKDETGRWLFFGLGNISKKHSDSIKSSDLIGFKKIVVTSDMVGKTIAVFTAVEVKRPDWKPSAACKRERAQRAFVTWINSNGGIAGIVNSIESFKRLLGV